MVMLLDAHQAERIIGKMPEEAFVDRGYRSRGAFDSQIYISSPKHGGTTRQKRLLKRRKAIEPVVRHMKNDRKQGCNCLKDTATR